jgi:hypothetical protein
MALTFLALVGTLIVVVPTRDGVVVGADSLATVAGGHIPSAPKLQTIDGNVRTIVTLTGTSEFYPPPPPGTKSDQLGNWIFTSQKMFSGDAIVREKIRELGDLILTEAMVWRIAEGLCEDLSHFFSLLPRHDIVPFIERELCRVLFVQFDASSRTMFLKSIAIRVDFDRQFRPTGFSNQEAPADHPVFAWRYGESDYVNANVLRGGSVGFAYLGDLFWRLFTSGKLVSTTTVDDAKLLIEQLISATERASATVPIPSAVGGKPYILLLDGVAAPRKVE